MCVYLVPALRIYLLTCGMFSVYPGGWVSLPDDNLPTSVSSLSRILDANELSGEHCYVGGGRSVLAQMKGKEHPVQTFSVGPPDPAEWVLLILQRGSC